MDILESLLDRTRYSKVELDRAILAAYKKALKDFKLAPSSPPIPHPSVPLSKKENCNCSIESCHGVIDSVLGGEGDEHDEHLEFMEELTVADTKIPPLQIVSPASPPLLPEEQVGPCAAGLNCMGHENCPCPESRVPVMQIVLPSSPVVPPGEQARPCMAGLNCRGNCPCLKGLTLSLPAHQTAVPKYCDSLCEGTSRPCQ